MHIFTSIFHQYLTKLLCPSPDVYHSRFCPCCNHITDASGIAPSIKIVEWKFNTATHFSYLTTMTTLLFCSVPVNRIIPQPFPPPSVLIFHYASQEICHCQQDPPCCSCSFEIQPSTNIDEQATTTMCVSLFPCPFF